LYDTPLASDIAGFGPARFELGLFVKEFTQRGSGCGTRCADIATVEGRATLLSACPHPDILVNNGGDTAAP
jgi:hypothetical protein